MVWWLRLRAPKAGGKESIPGWGTKIRIPHKEAKKKKKEGEYWYSANQLLTADFRGSHRRAISVTSKEKLPEETTGKVQGSVIHRVSPSYMNRASRLQSPQKCEEK